MIKILVFTFLFLIVINCDSQTEVTISNLDSFSITITLYQFNNLVDSCTHLLQNKNLSEISDSGHIYIIMCGNTIFYTRIKNRFQQRFDGDRYERFEAILENDSASYIHEITKIYPDWRMNAGVGIYFPKLNIEFGGRLHRHSLFRVIDK